LPADESILEFPAGEADTITLDAATQAALMQQGWALLCRRGATNLAESNPVLIQRREHRPVLMLAVPNMPMLSRTIRRDVMKIRTITRLLLITAGFSLGATLASAAETAKKPHVPLEKTIGTVTATAPVPSLAVLNSDGATLADGKLTLTGVSTNTIVFADRPVRSAGHQTTAQFIMQWDEGKDSFAVDPPNATVSVLGGDGSDVSDAVVILTKPKLDGANLTFEAKILEGSLEGANGPAALFIDWFAARGFRGGVAVGGGYHGYWHAPVYHGAWYGVHPGVVAGAAVAGAAVGAAAAADSYYPYYRPPCGYYPYSPCY